ncbi:MAG: very-short-patch-repair endonuclease [Phenylobacterium sp.]|jgi:very-short-patch-repair endonuclease
MQIKHRIRSLCRNASDAERDLWQVLQKRNLSGYKFQRKVPIKDWLVDFLCAELKLVIQLDDGEGTALTQEDPQKRQFLTNNGYRIVYFLHNEVLNNPTGVANCLLPTLARRGLELSVPSPYEINGGG